MPLSSISSSISLENSCSRILDEILELRQITRLKASLVGISGIDGSGKSYLARKLAAGLEQKGIKVALLHADGWLDLPKRRFSDRDPGKHFYDHAIRLDEMFERLVLPLKKYRSIDIESDLVAETATEFLRHRYFVEQAEVIVLEGIFIFKRAFRDLFDLKIWVECSFETAMERAVKRAQEGLSYAETKKAYQSIYFPAQQIHFDRDQPQQMAHRVISNNFLPR